jgi:peptide/nickel transport system substrate-binding protein
MRRSAMLCAGVITTLVLAACGGGGSSPSTKNATLTGLYGPSTAAVCKATPVHGGSVVYERQAATESLNPIDAKNGNGDIFADSLVYSGLVRSDPNGSNNIVPALAQRWTISHDGRTYTFYLRHGLKFSNGQPVTAEDVKWSMDRFGNPKIDAVMSSVAVGYGTSKVINNTTIQFHLAEPVASFLYNISIFPAFILPENLVLKEGAAFYNHPIGTGPFVVKSWVKGSHITFVRNPHYWEPGKPYLNSVRYNFATDSNSRILALQGGAAQIMDGVPFSQISTLEKNKTVNVQAAKVPLFLGLWLNHERRPLANLDVRKAMQFALNREEMNRDIFHGLGQIPNSVLMSLKYDAPDSVVHPYPYDVAKAKALMAKAGYPHGFSTTLQYPAGYDYYEQLALLMQQEYGAIGIKVKLIQEDPATNTSNWSTSSYDMIFPFASFTSDVTVPDEYANFLADYSNGLKGFYSNWRDPTIQRMVLKFQATLSNSARAKLWPKIQQALMNQTPVINVLNLPFVNAHSATTCGTDINALGADQLQDTWVSNQKAG